MPRAALRPADIAAFRRRAVDAAARLYAAHGPDALTMRGVADELGVSAMTPYRYVSGVAQLLALVRADAFRRFGDALVAATARRRDALARLRALKRAYVRFAVDDPDAYRIMFQAPPPGRARTPELARASRRAFGVLVGAVQAAIAAGALRGDALTIAHLAWASTHGLVSLHLAGQLTAGRTLARLAAVDHELASFRPAAPRRARPARAPSRPRKPHRPPHRKPHRPPHRRSPA